MTGRILVVGTDSKLAGQFPRDAVVELVSSVAFIEPLLFSFLPDLIVFDSIFSADVDALRKNEKLISVPVLIISRNLIYQENLERLVQAPRVVLFNSALCPHPGFCRRVSAMTEDRKSFLPSKTSSLVKNAIVFVNRHYSENLSREKIAGAINSSEDYLSRIFKKETGIPLWEYINWFRLDEARTLLVTDGLSVKETAHKCGFEDPAYFSRAFSQRYGHSPATVKL